MFLYKTLCVILLVQLLLVKILIKYKYIFYNSSNALCLKLFYFQKHYVIILYNYFNASTCLVILHDILVTENMICRLALHWFVTGYICKQIGRFWISQMLPLLQFCRNVLCGSYGMDVIYFCCGCFIYYMGFSKKNMAAFTGNNHCHPKIGIWHSVICPNVILSQIGINV